MLKCLTKWGINITTRSLLLVIFRQFTAILFLATVSDYLTRIGITSQTKGTQLLAIYGIVVLYWTLEPLIIEKKECDFNCHADTANTREHT